MSLKTMERESASEVGRIRTSVKNTLQALKVLGSPVDQWDHITVFLTVSRLHPSIQRKWESLDSFLETQRLALVQLESAKEILKDSKPKTSQVDSNKERGNHLHMKNPRSVNLAQDEKKSSSLFVVFGATLYFKVYPISF